jgi:hypothetical protein
MLRVQHHTPRLAIADKNFPAAQNLSPIGLGVSATQNAKGTPSSRLHRRLAHWFLRRLANPHEGRSAGPNSSASHTAFPSGDQRALDSDNQLGQPDVSESRPGNCRGQPQQHRIPACRSWCDRIVPTSTLRPTRRAFRLGGSRPTRGVLRALIRKGWVVVS